MEPSHIAFITVYPCLLPLYRCGGCPEFFYSICQTLAVQVTVQVLLHNGTELGVVIIRIIVIVRNELSVIVKACLESRDGFIKECCTFLYGKTGAECGMILYIGEEAGMHEFIEASRDVSYKQKSELCVNNLGYEQCPPGYQYGPRVCPYHLIHFVTAGKGSCISTRNAFRYMRGKLF